MYLLWFFEKNISIFWKNYTFFYSFPQPNFAIWLCFLAIFQRPQTYWGLWKIAKTPKNCTGWPVEMSNWKITSNLVFVEMGFSLNNTVEMHSNGSKCLRNEQILSLLGQDTLWVLFTMVWSHYFAVLSHILASGVA